MIKSLHTKARWHKMKGNEWKKKRKKGNGSAKIVERRFVNKQEC